MPEYNIAYYVNDNIQHFPPVLRLQEKLPGLILVRGEKILEHIRSRYPEFLNRTFLVKNNHQSRKLLWEHRIRLIIYPAFRNLNRVLAVEIFHGGVSDKRYLESIRITRYDLILFTGKLSCDKVKNANLLDKIISWEVVGYPKFDPFCDETLEYSPVFDNKNRTVLYAPTWISITKPGAKKHRFSQYGESSLPLWGLDILKNIPDDTNLIVKFHSLIHKGGTSIHEEMERYVSDNNLGHRIKLIYDDNIVPYMAQAGIMISDISAVCYEWFHFDRPIIFANPAPEHYQATDDISSNTYAWQTGDIINDSSDISRLIESNFTEDRHQKKRNEIFHYSLYRPDGKAADRQAESIKKLYDNYRHIPYTWFYFSMLCRHIGRWFYMNAVVRLVIKK
ncbi:MAG TPA: hypothetical protein ENJ87_00250 [Gammaproteobacteria bacterium]|nr:hypothetical protein [Gammaproteobacteria bacterium]